MNTAWRLPDGRIVIPMTASAEGVIGDGLVVVAPDSTEAREWERWTEDAPEDIIAWVSKDVDA